MAEWLYEDGIGEARAALVADGVIVEAAIERENGGVRAGAVVPARLERRLPETDRAVALLADGATVLVRGIPRSISEGRTILIAIMREAIASPVDPKPALGRMAAEDEAERAGPSLHDRISATGMPIRRIAPHMPDAFEAAGWSELLDEADTGLMPFAGGLLRLSLTPAMALIDVDGQARNAALAVTGAAAAGRMIRRMGIAGSIGIDLPTLTGKADRQAAAAALDAVLPQPFERTAVNGFGFLQIVRRRERASLPELIQGDRAGAAAMALLRRAERSGGKGALTITAHPAVTAVIERGEFLVRLARCAGAGVVLRPDPGLAISAGHVETEHP